MGIWVCDDALILTLKYMYIKGQQTQMFRSFGIKLPGHVVTACTVSATVKVKLSSQRFYDSDLRLQNKLKPFIGFGS